MVGTNDDEPAFDLEAFLTTEDLTSDPKERSIFNAAVEAHAEGDLDTCAGLVAELAALRSGGEVSGDKSELEVAILGVLEAEAKLLLFSQSQSATASHN